MHGKREFLLNSIESQTILWGIVGTTLCNHARNQRSLAKQNGCHTSKNNKYKTLTTHISTNGCPLKELNFQNMLQT